MLLHGYAGCRPIICRVNRVASVPRKYMLTSTGITERRRPTTDMANEYTLKDLRNGAYSKGKFLY